jgi:hypothetical protein
LNLQHQKSVESLRHSKDNELNNLRQKLDMSENDLKEALDKVYKISKGTYIQEIVNKIIEFFFQF